MQENASEPPLVRIHLPVCVCIVSKSIPITVTVTVTVTIIVTRRTDCDVRILQLQLLINERNIPHLITVIPSIITSSFSSRRTFYYSWSIRRRLRHCFHFCNDTTTIINHYITFHYTLYFVAMATRRRRVHASHGGTTTISTTTSVIPASRQPSSKNDGTTSSPIDTVDPLVRALNTIMYGMLVHFGTLWMFGIYSPSHEYDIDPQQLSAVSSSSSSSSSWLWSILLLHEYWVYLQHCNVLANPYCQRLDRQYGIALLKSNQHWAIAGKGVFIYNDIHIIYYY